MDLLNVLTLSNSDLVFIEIDFAGAEVSMDKCATYQRKDRGISPDIKLPYQHVPYNHGMKINRP